MDSNCILGLTAPQEKTEHSHAHDARHIHTHNGTVGALQVSATLKGGALWW